ncbi:hypothetical protein Sgly_1909 [Syntrophobotulus glycolicus DSM 8271]|uniref:Uncharacterized protein n=1 Tax=Syntrophobotulus glycolicus (strain DSM 8271 / FlGlyR) TaxID=645991 RepID=F0T0R6_SYNGF|nr:hypothetical protein Sgly_1909 [Syntrophobotulus glycolicus DSM 8271]
MAIVSLLIMEILAVKVYFVIIDNDKQFESV